jgi:hypothetical protein
MAIRQPSIFGAVDEGLTQLHVEPLGARPPWDYPVRHFRKIRACDPSPTQKAWRRHLLLHCSSRAETAILAVDGCPKTFIEYLSATAELKALGPLRLPD